MTESPPSFRSPTLPTFAWILAAVAGLAVFAGMPSLGGEFLGGDDEGLIRDHYYVNHPSWVHAGELLRMVHGDLYQPLPMLTFMANYAAGRAQTLGYHIVNIVVHALCAMCAALLAWRVSRDQWVALACGAMFACHPFAMESVAWITGRIILLAALFALGLLLLFSLRAETPGPSWALATSATWLLSLLSKVMPGVPIAAVWCDWNLYSGHHHHVPKESAAPAPPRRNRWWWTAVLVIVVESAAFTAFAYHTTSRLDYFKMMQAESTTAWPARVLLASRYYFENYVWPMRLSAWSPPPQNVALSSMTVGIGALEWLALIVVFIVSRRRCPTAFVGIGLFVLLLAPFLAAMTARTFLTADRYMYLPILGLHMAVAAWAVKAFGALNRPMARHEAAARPGSLSLVGRMAIVALLAVALNGWLVVGRGVARAFHDDFSQARRAIELHPDDPRAWTELARTHVKHAERAAGLGDQSKALNHADQAVQIVTEQRARGVDDVALAAEAGEAHWHAGRPDAAIPELTRAVAGMPRHQQAKYYLGLALQARGEVGRACILWKEIIAERSKFLPAATALARAYRDSGDTDEAIRWFNTAITLNPHHRSATFDLAELHMQRSEWPLAEPLLRRVLAISPDDLPAMMNLAVTRARVGDADEALAIYDRLIELSPDNPAVLFNRASVLAALRRIGESEAVYRCILQKWPGDRAAAIGLHELLAGSGRAADTVSLWQSVLQAANAPGDAPGWLAFSLAVSGKSQDALAESQRIAPGDAGLLLATWTLAWVELTREPIDVSALGLAITAAATRPVTDTRRRDQLRAVVLALTDLSRRRPDDAACCYALARALLQSEQPVLARRFLERARQLAEGSAVGKWAGDLLLRTSGAVRDPG